MSDRDGREVRWPLSAVEFVELLMSSQGLSIVSATVPKPDCFGERVVILGTVLISREEVLPTRGESIGFSNVVDYKGRSKAVSMRSLVLIVWQARRENVGMQ